MIDTIKIKINAEDIQQSNKAYLKSILVDKQVEKENGMTVVRGSIKNMKVKLDNRALTVMGSLTKYAVGDNLKSADKEQLKAAVEDLSKKLTVNLNSGIVRRIDVGSNLLTKYPVDEYYPFLIDLSKFNRNELHNGISFFNSTTEVVFYGKIREMKRKRDVMIDELFKDQHVLRYECQLGPERMQSILKIKKPTVADVFHNYSELVMFWGVMFECITKKGVVLEPLPEIFDKRGLYDRHLMVKGIESSGGLAKVLRDIDVGKGRGWFKKYPNVATNLRGRMKKLMCSPQLVKKSTLVCELEGKIQMATFCAICQSALNS
jgi:hypothetical protein